VDPSRADEAEEEEEEQTQAADKAHDNAPADATQTDTTTPATAPPPRKQKHRLSRQILPVLEHAVVDLAECDEASPSKSVASNTLTARAQHRLVEDADAFVTFHSQISVDGANATALVVGFGLSLRDLGSGCRVSVRVG